MDVSTTYSSATGKFKVMVYGPPELTMPDEFPVTLADGSVGVMMRLSDRSLECGVVPTRINARGEEVPVSGRCDSIDCHRRVLGECQCGRHTAPVPYERSV